MMSSLLEKIMVSLCLHKLAILASSSNVICTVHHFAVNGCSSSGLRRWIVVLSKNNINNIHYNNKKTMEIHFAQGPYTVATLHM